MHALLLGCIKHHLRELWKMDVKLDESTVQPAYKGSKTTQPSDDQMQKAWKTMRYGTDEDLSRLPLSVIKELAVQIDSPAGKRNRLIQFLMEHVRKILFYS